MAWQRRSGRAPVYATKAHRAARAALLAAYQPGDPCVLCGHGMYPPTSALHADHDPLTGGYRGLAHGSAPCEVCGLRCNAVDGARRGRARVGQDPERVTTLQW